MNVDLIRVPSIDYPQENYFDNPTSLLIETTRRQEYEKEGEHFENVYAISFCYLPSAVENETMGNVFVMNAKREETPRIDFHVGIFNQKLSEFEGSISNRIRIKRMTSSEIMTFLHRCISGQKHIIPVPEPPCYLNHFLGAHEFVAGHEPMVDEYHVGVITLTQFPFESFCGILNVLSALPFEYRFSVRFRFYDPVDALNILNEYQGKYMGMKYNAIQMIMGALGKDPRLDPDAANRSVLTKIE
jgi:type IV secretion system protein VirB4